MWVDGRGHHLRPEHVFTDDGYSGTRLDRPALDRLRDAAREGEIDVVAVYTPDRLARKYAYQYSACIAGVRKLSHREGFR